MHHASSAPLFTFFLFETFRFIRVAVCYFSCIVFTICQNQNRMVRCWYL
uniref:Uncharacterized protein n=1 Tax=Arundo donax TaxID=35708 RepID=A0A0A8Z1E1_ARUDO